MDKQVGHRCRLAINKKVMRSPRTEDLFSHHCSSVLLKTISRKYDRRELTVLYFSRRVDMPWQVSMKPDSAKPCAHSICSVMDSWKSQQIRAKHWCDWKQQMLCN
eukprot:3529963-Amphidinium_carterae.1